jgi:hypothetical protein
LIQESRYFIDQFLKDMTRGVKRAVGIIFDIKRIILAKNGDFA